MLILVRNTTVVGLCAEKVRTTNLGVATRGSHPSTRQTDLRGELRHDVPVDGNVRHDKRDEEEGDGT